MGEYYEEKLVLLVLIVAIAAGTLLEQGRQGYEFKIQMDFIKSSKLNRKCVDKPKGECYFISRIFQHSLLLSANNAEIIKEE